MQLKNQGKKFFLISTPDEEKIIKLDTRIRKRFPEAVIYLAADHLDCLQKLENAPPQIFITDYALAKAKPGQMVDFILSDPQYKTLPMIVLSTLPEKEIYLDELVTGKIQFMPKVEDEEEFDRCLTKALNFAAKGDSMNFKIRFLSAGDILIREGDLVEQVYIVKKGALKAYQTKDDGMKKILGEIQSGEFVGEMGYFNGEARLCHVQAITECELIEVPLGTFEKILYLRPAWSKKLMETLSKRLKKSSEGEYF
jgi:CRP/FNR family cyclic AMP-dependent transcriptional regulator